MQRGRERTHTKTEIHWFMLSFSLWWDQLSAHMEMWYCRLMVCSENWRKENGVLSGAQKSKHRHSYRYEAGPGDRLDPLRWAHWELTARCVCLVPSQSRICWHQETQSWSNPKEHHSLRAACKISCHSGVRVREAASPTLPADGLPGEHVWGSPGITNAPFKSHR